MHINKLIIWLSPIRNMHLLTTLKIYSSSWLLPKNYHIFDSQNRTKRVHTDEIDNV